MSVRLASLLAGDTDMIRRYRVETLRNGAVLLWDYAAKDHRNLKRIDNLELFRLMREVSEIAHKCPSATHTEARDAICAEIDFRRY